VFGTRECSLLKETAPDCTVNGIGSTLYDPGNEPSFATPFLYNYLPRSQHRRVQRSRDIVDTYYSAAEDGLPGNSDAGALDSWLVWNMLGLYSVATQDVYLLLSAWFEDVSVHVGEGRRLRITTKDLGGEGRHFVQSVRVNGESWDRSWATHGDLVGGGEAGGTSIEFVLGEERVGLGYW
jgi:putative alpha-1,2-mannosidase